MTEASSAIVISRIDTGTLEIPIVGTSPLVMHKFSQKSKQTMLDAMQGRRNPKEPKDPDREYAESQYKMDDGTPAFPVLAFKAATVGAARFYGKAVSMTSLRQFLFFQGEWSDVEGQSMVRINGEPKLREDIVRVGNGGTDLRYRAEFADWSATLKVIFVKSALTKDSVASLVDAGGMGVGVGEWRPERRGDFGCYTIDASKEIVATD